MNAWWTFLLFCRKIKVCICLIFGTNFNSLSLVSGSHQSLELLAIVIFLEVMQQISELAVTYSTFQAKAFSVILLVTLVEDLLSMHLATPLAT